MKTRLLSIIMLGFLLSNSAIAQEKFLTKDSYAKFYSEAPLENIEAHNNKVQSIIDIVKNDVVISMPISGFTFENSLMQEHFNENYMESEKFPKAEFSGVFTSETPIKTDKDADYEVMVKGNLTIHGVTKAVSTKGMIKVRNNTIEATTTFLVKVADHEIEIPRIAFKNIAEDVEVSVVLKYKPFKS